MPDYSNIAKKAVAFGVTALGKALPFSVLDNGDGTGTLATGSLAYRVFTLTDATAQSAAATYLVAVVNKSLNVQNVSVTAYDNPSAASGPTVALVAALGPTQIITWPPPGRPLASGGLTAQASGIPTSAGIEFYVR